MSPERRGATNIRHVRAELRSLDSTEAQDGLASFRPDDPEAFLLSVAAQVGPGEGHGEELFYFNVCTAQWLAENPPPKGFHFLHSYLLVGRWDYDVVEHAISDLCRRSEGEDWHEIAVKLSRYGAWEFADYRESE
jgi:hypothetical protein